MTDEQKAAYVMAQAACAMAEIAGMQAENFSKFSKGEQPYGKQAFDDVINRNGIHHNAVLSLFQGG